jgi:hypothetical protein
MRSNYEENSKQKHLKVVEAFNSQQFKVYANLIAKLKRFLGAND